MFYTDWLIQNCSFKNIPSRHTSKLSNVFFAGDRGLLENTLDTDEFDILSAAPINFVKLPDDHRLLIGYDDVHIIQAFDALLYMNSDDTNRIALRSFVAEKLKSKKRFLDLTLDDQRDILSTYRDLLLALQHDGKRLIAFAFHILRPILQAYVDSKKFRFFSTKPILRTLDRIASLRSEYNEFVPSQEFFRQSIDGGIQRAL